ncbi:hypothetical protein BST61_g10233 [Cercospora zeina]
MGHRLMCICVSTADSRLEGSAMPNVYQQTAVTGNEREVRLPYVSDAVDRISLAASLRIKQYNATMQRRQAGHCDNDPVSPAA